MLMAIGLIVFITVGENEEGGMQQSYICGIN